MTAKVHAQLFAATSRGLRWSYGGTIARSLLQFGLGVCLARILGPHPYGLVAAAMLPIGLGALISDGGLTLALVQRAEVSPQQVASCFLYQCLIGCVLFLCGWLSAPLLAGLMHQPPLVGILRWLSAIFILQAAGMTSTAWLRRTMDFRTLQLIQISSYVVGYLLIGLPLALEGHGVWALVAASLSQALLATLLLLSFGRVPFSQIRLRLPRDMFQFGSSLMLTNLLNWGLANLDTIVVGRRFGATDLGYYNRVSTLIATPGSVALPPLQNVLFTTYARLQEDRIAASELFLGCLNLVALVFAPMMAAAAAAPLTVVTGIFGPAWAASSALVLPMALGAWLNACMCIVGPLLWGQGHYRREMLAQALTLAVMVPTLLLCHAHTVMTIAELMFGINALRLTLVIRAAARCNHASMPQLLKAFLPAVALGVGTYLATRLADAVLLDILPNATARLGCLIAVVLIGLMATLLLFRSILFLPVVLAQLPRVWGRLGSRSADA